MAVPLIERQQHLTFTAWVAVAAACFTSPDAGLSTAGALASTLAATVCAEKSQSFGRHHSTVAAKAVKHVDSPHDDTINARPRAKNLPSLAASSTADGLGTTSSTAGAASFTAAGSAGAAGVGALSAASFTFDAAAVCTEAKN